MHGKLKFPLNPESKLTKLFEDLCATVSYEELGALTGEIGKAVGDFAKIKDTSLAPNMRLVHALEKAARLLLLRYPHEEAIKQRLIVGAVRYFCTSRDFVHDHRPLVGLDDDILVINHVLEALGIEGEFILV